MDLVKEGHGLSLRFPRFLRMRPGKTLMWAISQSHAFFYYFECTSYTNRNSDKTKLPSGVTTAHQLSDMYRQQSKVGSFYFCYEA